MLADAADGGAAPPAMPLFERPVREDPVLARALMGLHGALVGGGGDLVRDEWLTASVTAMVRLGATRPPRDRVISPGGQARAVRRARALLEESYALDLPAPALAEAAGCSRYALYRAFRAEYGMPPSDFRRQLRLRRARRLLAAGRSTAEAAAEAGFADQSHLHRWFGRYFGVTPGAYQRAVLFRG